MNGGINDTENDATHVEPGTVTLPDNVATALTGAGDLEVIDIMRALSNSRPAASFCCAFR